MLARGKTLFAGDLRPEMLARLAAPVNILLIILLAYELAGLTWRLLPPPPPLPTAVEASVAEPEASPDSVAADYAAIAGWHLFGQASTAAPEPLAQAPETKLNLKLIGIYYAESDGLSRAIIAAGGGKAAIYSPGDKLQGGIEVAQIHEDYVLIARQGGLEKLSLHKEPGQTSHASPRASPPQEDIQAAAGGVIDASAVASSLRQEAGGNPQALQKLAFVSPYMQSGQFVGFRLRPGRDRNLLGRLGLRNGDVITEVNGARLNDPGQGMALLEQLVTGEQVSIQVLRNGTEIPFTFIMNAH